MPAAPASPGLDDLGPDPCCLLSRLEVKLVTRLLAVALAADSCKSMRMFASHTTHGCISCCYSGIVVLGKTILEGGIIRWHTGTTSPLMM